MSRASLKKQAKITCMYKVIWPIHFFKKTLNFDKKVDFCLPDILHLNQWHILKIGTLWKGFPKIQAKITFIKKVIWHTKFQKKCLCRLSENLSKKVLKRQSHFLTKNFFSQNPIICVYSNSALFTDLNGTLFIELCQTYRILWKTFFFKKCSNDRVIFWQKFFVAKSYHLYIFW